MIDAEYEAEIEIADRTRLPEHPVVSVQMLTYNHGRYIEQAIEGVLAQRTDFPIELLIAEDASTDDTREIAMRYQRARPDVIRIITGSMNVGARANRHRVARHIRGEFVAFCEGDDYWTDPEKLQRQVDWLRANRHTGAVHTDFDHAVTRGGREFRLRNFQKYRYGARPVPAGNIFATLLRGNFIQTCTLCVRAELDRECLERGFLKDSYPVGDWPLCLYIASKCEITYLAQATAVYRKVEGSMVNSGYARRAQMVTKCIPMIEDFCRHFKVSPAEESVALAQLYRTSVSLALFAGDKLGYENALAWLCRFDPAYAQSWRGRLLPWLARMPGGRRILRLIQDVRTYGRELTEYH